MERRMWHNLDFLYLYAQLHYKHLRHGHCRKKRRTTNKADTWKEASQVK